jgi:hypothetical protein
LNELNSLASRIIPLRVPNSIEKYPLVSEYPSPCGEPLHTVSMTTGSGGGVPSSIITRPLIKIGCGMLTVGVCVGLVGFVFVGVVVRPGDGVVVPGVVPVVLPPPVGGGVVVAPLPWPVAHTGINNPTAAVAVIALTQFFEAIRTSVDCIHYPTKIECRMLTARRTPVLVVRMAMHVIMPKPSILPAIALLAILTACSDTPTTTTAVKRGPEKVEPVTGQTAIFKMYQMARSWASDSQVMKSKASALRGQGWLPGTAAGLQATFVSQAKARRAATRIRLSKVRATSTRELSPDPRKAGAATVG